MEPPGGGWREEDIERRNMLDCDGKVVLCKVRRQKKGDFFNGGNREGQKKKRWGSTSHLLEVENDEKETLKLLAI